jgi:hypothetical protein
MIANRIALIFVISFIFFSLSMPAHAEMGPCLPDEPREVIFCGSGNGAAFVIRETTSPSGKFALAWRSPSGPPSEQPNDDIQLLIIRLADGAILWQGITDYWDTGEMHVNRLQEKAGWSPDSRWMVRSFESRFSTDNVDLYALGADDHVSGPFDLLQLLDAGAREKLKGHVKNADDYSFSLTSRKENEKPLRLDNQGNIRAEVMLWMPKSGPFYYYTVNARAKRSITSLDARIVSIVYRGMEKGEPD